MSLQRCQEETTSTQFLDWIEYLELDVNAFHREDHFWANIATEIRRSFVKEPGRVRMGSFLLKFARKKIAKRRPMTRKEAAERSKQKWFSWLGIKGKK